MEKQLRRDPNNKVLGGVCAGLANYMDIDPVAVRHAFVLGTLFWGVGPIAYLNMWLIVPVEGS